MCFYQAGHIGYFLPSSGQSCPIDQTVRNIALMDLRLRGSILYGIYFNHLILCHVSKLAGSLKVDITL